MGLGILEPKVNSGHVPGTVYLDTAEGDSDGGDGLRSAHLKKGTGKYADIILVPQPSSDPNDPLNWPLWQRDLILGLYCYCTLLCIGALGPILGTISIPLITAFDTDFKGVSLFTGYQLCTVGASAVFVSAFARRYGKRPLAIFSMSAILAGSAWGATAKSYGSFMGSRVLQGLGIAMFESVTYVIMSDLYHVHQRGSRMAWYTLAQSGAAQLPSLIAGKMSETMGWRWCFYFITIFAAIGWVLCIFIGWETQFNRSELLNLDTVSQDTIILKDKTEGSVEQVESAKNAATLAVTDSPVSHAPREPFWQRLRLYHGVFDHESLLLMILRPFYVLLNPAVIWALVIIAFNQVWFIITNFVIAQAFSPPPYNLTVTQIGYMGAGPWVGGMLGCLASGLICDPAARYMTKRNKGVYEPEFRLFLMLLVPIFSTVGYFTFGNLIAQGKSPVAASVVYGLCFVTVQMAAVATGAYINDAFREINVEIFIISMLFKNFIRCCHPVVLNDWYASWGPVKMFSTIGGISLGMAVTTIPVYVYGKRLRAWWHAHDVLRRKKAAA